MPQTRLGGGDYSLRTSALPPRRIRDIELSSISWNKCDVICVEFRRYPIVHFRSFRLTAFCMSSIETYTLRSLPSINNQLGLKGIVVHRGYSFLIGVMRYSVTLLF